MRRVSFGFAVAFLIGCNGVSSTTAPQPSTVDGEQSTSVERQISSPLSGADRQLMIQVLRALPPGIGTDVTVQTPDGRLISNVVDLGNRSAFATMVDAESGIFKRSDGETFVASESYFPAAAQPDTGLFRRVLTGSGLSSIGGSTSAPCNITNIPPTGTKNKDTGYIYTGGTSSTGIGIDAGLQYSPAKSAYLPYYLYKGKPSDEPDQFQCGPNDVLTLSFIPQSTALVLSISGKLTDGTSTTKNYVLPVGQSDGWSTPSSSLKRVVSLAQTKTELDGYYFGLSSASSNSPLIDVRLWSISKPGSTPQPVSALNSTIASFPNNAKQVIVKSDGVAYDEHEAINAHK